MSSAAGTGTFVECPKCKPGSGKPIGHLGRHLGVLVPVCPPAPVEVLASAETVAGRRERKQVQRWSDDPLSTAQLGGEQGKLDELKRNGVAGSGAAGRASARDPAPAKGSSRGPKKSPAKPAKSSPAKPRPRGRSPVRPLLAGPARADIPPLTRASVCASRRARAGTATHGPPMSAPEEAPFRRRTSRRPPAQPPARRPAPGPRRRRRSPKPSRRSPPVPSRARAAAPRCDPIASAAASALQLTRGLPLCTEGQALGRGRREMGRRAGAASANRG